MWTNVGGKGVAQMTTTLNASYLVKVSTWGEGVKICPRPRGLYTPPNLLFDSGISRPESPQATANPWKIKDDQGVSRRSSTLSQMPEVMVTNVSDKDKKAPIDEDRPKLSVTELMNLLPV